MSAVRPATQATTTTPAARALLLAALAIAIIGAVIGATEPIRAMFQGAATERLVTITPGAVLFASNLASTGGVTLVEADPKPSLLAVTGSLGEIILCVLAAVLAVRLLRGRVFSRALSIAVAVGGLVVAVVGVVYEAVAASSSGSDVLGLTLIVTGVLLLLFGTAFRHGRALAQDAEGLV